MKRTALKRTPFKIKPKTKKTSKGLFDHLKKESKDQEDQRIKREILDPYFINLGLYYVCELNLPSTCIGNSLPLQYAHSKKRGDIALKEPERTRELCEVVRACTACHNEIEYIAPTPEETGRKIMYRIVIATIENRNKLLDKFD